MNSLNFFRSYRVKSPIKSFRDLEVYQKTIELSNEVTNLTYGQYDASFNNIISAQVLYISYNLSLDEPFSDIYYSEWANLTARFFEELISFEDICIQTCILPDLNATSYKIRFEIENSSLVLDSIKYGILINMTINETTNHAPILLKNFSNISFFRTDSSIFNLSEYFYDEDNDTLIFSYYNNSRVNIVVINETATLTSENFTCSDYMFFTANDSMYLTSSNIFGVEVKEKEETQRDIMVGGFKSLRKMIGLT